MNFASKAVAFAALTGVALASGVASAADGKAVYDKVCTVCHAAGVANAPKFGDKAAWAPRVAQGKDALFSSVVKGKGAMPPRAGNADLKDDEIKAAIDYMVGAAK
jgi:cytochrome c5